MIGEIQGWISIAVVVAVNLVAIVVGWQKLVARINGLGRRVKDVENKVEKNTGRIDAVGDEQATCRDSYGRAHERLGSVEQAYKDLSEKITDMQISLAGHLGEIKQMITANSAATGERMARLETRIELSNPKSRQ